MLTKKMYPTAPPLHTFEKSLPFSLHLGFFSQLALKTKIYCLFFGQTKKLHTNYIPPV